MEYLTFFMGYLGICLILFRYPLLVRKKVQDFRREGNRSIWVVAHRGGSSERPENTIEAFRNSQFSDMLELDVVNTKDNVIVVSHDSHLMRVAGREADIRDLAYEELPCYQRVIKSHFLEDPFVCDRVYNFTSLEQVFKEFPDKFVSVDIKTPNDCAVQGVKELVRKYNRAGITVNYK